MYVKYLSIYTSRKCLSNCNHLKTGKRSLPALLHLAPLADLPTPNSQNSEAVLALAAAESGFASAAARCLESDGRKWSPPEGKPLTVPQAGIRGINSR